MTSPKEHDHRCQSSFTKLLMVISSLSSTFLLTYSDFLFLFEGHISHGFSSILLSNWDGNFQSGIFVSYFCKNDTNYQVKWCTLILQINVNIGVSLQLFKC